MLEQTEFSNTPGLLKIAERIKEAQKKIEENDGSLQNLSDVDLDSLSIPAMNSDTYLIFSIRESRFAINTSKLLQISVTKVFSLPFVPEYIEGVINVHGTPFTVVNTLKLENFESKDKNSDSENSDENKTELSGSTFLVLNRKDDQFCIHIANIELFFEPEEEDIQEDKIRYKHRFVPIFDDERIEDALCRDLGRY